MVEPYAHIRFFRFRLPVIKPCPSGLAKATFVAGPSFSDPLILDVDFQISSTRPEPHDYRAMAKQFILENRGSEPKMPKDWFPSWAIYDSRSKYKKTILYSSAIEYS